MSLGETESTDEEVRRRTCQACTLEKVLRERRTWRLGHIIRMEEVRCVGLLMVPKQTPYYWEVNISNKKPRFSK